MTEIIKERVTVDNKDEIVVFLIGMRVNKVWKLNKWLPVAMAMPRMIRELLAQPELGLLHAQTTLNFPTTIMIQYWRSYEQLATYAANRNAAHLPAWRDFNRRVASNGDVGIWHETYRVPAGQYEAIYNNMPPFGLGTIYPLIPATGPRESSVARMAAKKRDELTHP
ncbi:MAG TPA: DUF4188 domain-containing protein [Ktedonobacteraceae bacterium]|jgi:hypothetical protein|nr:DUF4188 domain-containing protein [Ktedonobacteraceae bacterium]